MKYHRSITQLVWWHLHAALLGYLLSKPYLEIDQTPNVERRARVRLLAEAVHHFVRVAEVDRIRAEQLEQLGFSGFDALHIACAERGKADVFLTTDRQILRCAERERDLLRVQVYNPLTWLKEVLGE